MLKNKFIIGLIGIYIFWIGILPFIVSKTMVCLCKNYSYNSSYNVELVNPKVKLSFIPVGFVSFDKVVFETKNELLKSNINNIEVKIRLLPLLSGKVHVNSLSIGNIKLLANLFKELELDKNFVNDLEALPIKLDYVSIGEFEALFYEKDIKNPIVYKGKDFNFQRKNRYIKLKNNSTLNVAGKISKITSNLFLPKNNDIKKTVFDIEISNIDVAPLKAYFKHYLPKELQELRGQVNIKASKEGLVTELTNCGIIMKDSAKSIIFPQKMFIKSKFNINRKFINFESIDIESQNIHISADGRISDYLGKAISTLDFKVRLNKSRVEDIINLLPPFKIEELDVHKLKKYKFYGETLANIRVKGRLPEPDVLGDVYIDNGILMKPIPNTSKGATIKLNLVGRTVNFNIVVPAGFQEKVWVEGSQELYNIKYADLTVKSTDSVDLKVAQNVMNPLHEILNFIIGPVPIMDISGNGNIDIRVKGNRKNPHVWGIFNIKNGVVNFCDAPDFVVTKTDAALKFNDQNANFLGKKGLLNGKEISISGSCDLTGKFDFDISSQNQPTEALYKALKTATIIPDIQKMLPKLDFVSGKTNFDLKIYGAVKNLKDLKVNQNIFAKGDISLINSAFGLQNILVNKTNGQIKIDTYDSDSEITAYIGDLPLSVKSKIKNNIVDLFLDIPKFNPNFLINDDNIRKKQYLPMVSVLGKYKGRVDVIDYDKLNLKAVILDTNPSGMIKYQPGGVINIDGKKLIIKALKGYINDKQNNFDINMTVNEVFNKNIEANGNIKIKTPDLSLFNEILTSDILPKTLKKYIQDYKFRKGVLNLNAKVVNNKINAFTDLSGVSFVYLPLELPVEIINGSLSVKSNTLKLNKINLLADKMPVLADGEIKDIFDKQTFNLYFNSKPQQEFIDKYINKNQIYPIKIKGDIVYWIKLKGEPEDYDLKAQIDMSKDSSIYHFGATIGDVENAIEVSIDSKVAAGNNHKIKEFSYDKIIDSQSGRQTRLNMLKAWGGVEILKDDLVFENLHIKTNHPTDARIFNIIFRKPNIKQGQFTSDLKFNGKLSNAKVLGDFHIFETNIPFLDTSMKNIELVFKDKIIEFASKGEIMGNDITFDGVLKNRLTTPYKIEKAYFYTKDLDLNTIVNKLKIAEVENVSTFESIEGFDLTSIVANNFKFKADNVQLRNIHATDFEAVTSISEKGIFDVKDFKFNIAQGTLGGKYSYNLKNSDMGINLKAESISANDISWALFDLNNQIYGDLTGDVSLTCNGSDFRHCMETLSGNTTFNVKDGRMPKLGSLEYLLKAGNLVKGGFTGLSINSVIDLLTPAKTGDFSEIFGTIRIKNGVARNIEISTKGEDLSLFIGGTYNFATSIAEMEVLGLLSRKISTMFGPIGNMSINTLFNVIPGVDLSKDSLLLERINKVPGIELSSKAYRKFVAEIKGNINGDNYVTSFKWIN